MTPRGLAFLPTDASGANPAPLPHAAGAAMLALLYAETAAANGAATGNGAIGGGGSSPASSSNGGGANGSGRRRDAVAHRLECFALGQVDYILGGQSGRREGFLVGFGAPQWGAAVWCCCDARAVMKSAACPLCLL